MPTMYLPPPNGRYLNGVYNGYPFDPKVQMCITSPYLDVRYYQDGSEYKHRAVDFAPQDYNIPMRGQHLFSPVDGTIVETIANASGSAYGNAVLIEGDRGGTVLLAHMLELAGIARPGVKVKRGTFVGRADNTGKSTGDHTHVQTSRGDQRTIFSVEFIVDPIPWLLFQAQFYGDGDI